MSPEIVLHCDFEKENLRPTRRVIGYRLQMVASENPDLSHSGSIVVLLFRVALLQGLLITTINNNNNGLQHKFWFLTIIQQGMKHNRLF